MKKTETNTTWLAVPAGLSVSV